MLLCVVDCFLCGLLVNLLCVLNVFFFLVWSKVLCVLCGVCWCCFGCRFCGVADWVLYAFV